MRSLPASTSGRHLAALVAFMLVLGTAAAALDGVLS
jgi:hypothetical protein